MIGLIISGIILGLILSEIFYWFWAVKWDYFKGELTGNIVATKMVCLFFGGAFSLGIMKSLIRFGIKEVLVYGGITLGTIGLLALLIWINYKITRAIGKKK